MTNGIPAGLYLYIGASLFLILLLGFRSISLSMDRRSEPSAANDEWVGKTPLELIRTFDETRDVRSLVFKRPGGKPFPKFKPGQFLSFQIGDDPKVLRSYSISSSPDVRDTIQVSVKRLSNGLGSGWMHSLIVGSKVIAFPPSGLFVENSDQKGHQVFVAGGIGITPFMSMLLNRINNPDDRPVSLFYGMRSTQDMAFHDLLVFLSKRMTAFNYYPILSEGDPSWNGDVGFASFDYMNSKLIMTDDLKFYFCGPPVMTDKIMAGLREMGIGEERLHSEKFVSPTTFDRGSLEHRNLNLTWNGQLAPYQGKQTVLESLEQANISHPYACRVGVCGSCKCQVKGKFIHMTDAGLSPDEKKSGYCLACVAFPLEDLEIKVI